MATPLESFGILGSDVFLKNELMRTYTDSEQLTQVLLKWIDAKSAFSTLKDQPAYATARVKWDEACRVMGKAKGNYVTLCGMLDGLTTSLRQCQQPGTVSKT